MKESKKQALTDLFGAGVSVMETLYCAGGDINEACILMLSDTNAVFLKENSRHGADFFKAEADGLSALDSMKEIRVPKVLAFGEEGGRGFLLLEVIRSKRPGADFWETFGRKLARFHKADPSGLVPGGRYGLAADNYIGATKQSNTPKDSWIGFYREERLLPQIRMAEQRLDAHDRKRADFILEHLDQWMEEPAFPSLLHGDLWSGNFMTDQNGEPVLIDPAAYVGHAEADIAMTELFGGFGYDFYRGYYAENPQHAGYEDRKDLYHLYHMLNHLNLFGGGYYGEVARILRRYAG